MKIISTPTFLRFVFVVLGLVMNEANPNAYPPSGGGDPHFTTWGGNKYDFHGVCDLILLENNEFMDNIGIDIHIRTKQMKQWSYISNVALRIKNRILEVSGAKDGSVKYWIDGVPGDEIDEEETILKHTLSGYPISFQRVNSKQNKFTIDLGNEEKIIIKTYKDMTSVSIHNGSRQSFGSSKGMMGTFDEGERIGRDNSAIEDVNTFGQDWQVLETDPKLFHSINGPQQPMQKCLIPSSMEARRRLREGTITEEQAELACANVHVQDRDMCIFDVMATNDVDVAGAY